MNDDFVKQILHADPKTITARQLSEWANVIEELFSELDEQARLLGKGGEREAKLASDNFALRAENARLFDALDKSDSAYANVLDENAKLREELEALKKFEREKWTGWAARTAMGESDE